MSLTVGQVITFERLFTKEDVELFTQVSKDEGNHHIKPNEVGAFVVQGLLTATLPTKIGGDYNVLARTMNFEFLRPVFTDDTIKCEVTIAQYEERNETSDAITASFICTNDVGKIVLTGNFSGVILK